MTLSLITTGGTIATVENAAHRTSASLRSGQVAGLSDTALSSAVEVRELALSPSWALAPSELVRIATAARDDARSGRFEGVVVTHGTSTLEYSAFLAELFNDTDTPIVFTGAMRLANAAEPDGPRNLSDALRVAADPQSRGHRSLAVFAGQVIEARHAWKMKRDETDTFISTGGRPGTVSATEVRLPAPLHRRPVFSGEIDERVALAKVYPGMQAEILDAASGPNVRGLVIEAFAGAGGVPSHLHATLLDAARRMPVVIASRAPVGRVPSPPTGGTGEPLGRMGLISAGDLTSEKAWLLLMAALGQASSEHESKSLFEAYASA